MRVRVQSTWRTRVLVLLAILASGVIAWFQVERREATRERDRTDERRGSEERGGPYEVEVELAD